MCHICTVHYLQCKGKPIAWSHLEDLYEKDTRSGQEATGLRLVPKLKFEHIYLSSFSKMRVDLAAQVISTCTCTFVYMYLYICVVCICACTLVYICRFLVSLFPMR